MLMFALAFGLAVVVHRYLRTCAPSNAIVARVRQGRPRLRIAAGLLVLSVALAFCGIVLADWVANGGPGWLNLIVVIAIWDAFKFTFLAIGVALGRALALLSARGSSVAGVFRLTRELG